MGQRNQVRHRTGKMRLFGGLAVMFALLPALALAACGDDTTRRLAAPSADGREASAPETHQAPTTVINQVRHVGQDGDSQDGEERNGASAEGAPAIQAARGGANADATGQSSAPDERKSDGRDPALTTALSPSEVAAALEAAMIGLYQEVLPSVAYIQVTYAAPDAESRRFQGVPEDFPDLEDWPDLPDGFPDLDEFFRRYVPDGDDFDFRRAHGQGSGFVWDDNGHVVTNHHVVDGAEKVAVGFADGTTVEATVLGSDPDSDLAVLKLDEDVDYARPVRLADSSSVRVGQLAIAIGDPFGQEFTMTTGIVSAVGRSIRSGASQFSVPEVIQTDAAINPGNSGGPLFDRTGEVIGINTQILSRSGSNAGVGFAVPVNIVQRVVPALIDDGEYQHSWLGIRGQDVHPEILELMGLPSGIKGTHVLTVADDSPAHRGGLRGADEAVTAHGNEIKIGGDIIVEIDGQEVDGIAELIAYLSNYTRPDDTVTLGVIRDGAELDLDITLASRP